MAGSTPMACASMNAARAASTFVATSSVFSGVGADGIELDEGQEAT
jgi:hypothetical protein